MCEPSAGRRTTSAAKSQKALERGLQIARAAGGDGLLVVIAPVRRIAADRATA